MARRRGSSDADKQNQERRVFLEFAKLSGLPVDPETIENRKPPEPDILCVVGGERIAFELAAICNPELAKDIGDQIKRGTKPKYQVLGDPSREAFLSKLKKAYETDAPIELVLYTGWTAVLDDLSIPALRDLANTQGT